MTLCQQHKVTRQKKAFAESITNESIDQNPSFQYYKVTKQQKRTKTCTESVTIESIGQNLRVPVSHGEKQKEERNKIACTESVTKESIRRETPHSSITQRYTVTKKTKRKHASNRSPTNQSARTLSFITKPLIIHPHYNLPVFSFFFQGQHACCDRRRVHPLRPSARRALRSRVEGNVEGWSLTPTFPTYQTPFSLCITGYVFTSKEGPTTEKRTDADIQSHMKSPAKDNLAWECAKYVVNLQAAVTGECICGRSRGEHKTNVGEI